MKEKKCYSCKHQIKGGYEDSCEERGYLPIRLISEKAADVCRTYEKKD